MTKAPQTICRPLSGTTPEQARDARARAWLRVFEHFNSRVGKEAAQPAAPNDDVEESNGYVATSSLPEPR